MTGSSSTRYPVWDPVAARLAAEKLKKELEGFSLDDEYKKLKDSVKAEVEKTSHWPPIPTKPWNRQPTTELQEKVLGPKTIESNARWKEITGETVRLRNLAIVDRNAKWDDLMPYLDLLVKALKKFAPELSHVNNAEDNVDWKAKILIKTRDEARTCPKKRNSSPPPPPAPKKPRGASARPPSSSSSRGGGGGEFGGGGGSESGGSHRDRGDEAADAEDDDEGWDQFDDDTTSAYTGPPGRRRTTTARPLTGDGAAQLPDFLVEMARNPQRRSLSGTSLAYAEGEGPLAVSPFPVYPPLCMTQ